MKSFLTYQLKAFYKAINRVFGKISLHLWY